MEKEEAAEAPMSDKDDRCPDRGGDDDLRSDCRDVEDAAWTMRIRTTVIRTKRMTMTMTMTRTRTTGRLKSSI
jgi:hypothetical protein